MKFASFRYDTSVNLGDQVQSFAQYGLQDGRVIDINTQRSPVYGEDTSILSTLLRTSKGTQTGPMLGNKIGQ